MILTFIMSFIHVHKLMFIYKFLSLDVLASPNAAKCFIHLFILNIFYVFMLVYIVWGICL